MRLSKLKSPTPTLQFPDNTRNKADLTEYLCMCYFICDMAPQNERKVAFTGLTGRSVRRHTWVLMGPGSNKMLKPD